VNAYDTLSRQTISRTAEFTVKAPQETKTAAKCYAGEVSKVKQERLRILGALVLTAMVSSFAAIPAAAQAKPVRASLLEWCATLRARRQMGASVSWFLKPWEWRPPAAS